MKSIINFFKTTYLQLISCLLVVLLIGSLTGCSNQNEVSTSAEEEAYSFFTSLYAQDTVYPEPYTASHDLCVTDTDVSLAGFEKYGIDGAVALFDLTDQTVLEGNMLFEQMYPASTTKVMTAYLALTRCNLDDVVTVGDLSGLDPQSSVAGLASGDTLTVRDLIYAIMLPSGNDASLALAEHISGSEEAFVALMNETAQSLFMTGTHFENSHGLHSDGHYTTAYDLYLIFQECLRYDMFRTIIDTPSYTASVVRADGSTLMMSWEATNYYFQGLAESPTNVSILGGKTGTTDEAGSCLILFSRDQDGREFVSVIMNALNKQYLYTNMTDLLSLIPPVS